MAEPSPPSSSRRSTREARQARRWPRVARGIAVVVLGAAIVGGVLVATGVLDLPGRGRAAGTRGPGTTSTTAAAVVRPVQERRRALSHDKPLRLWIAGDSLAGSVGPSLGEISAATGIVQPQFYSKVSSGLTDPGFFDWPETAREQLALLDPEVVVFVVGTNDANTWNPADAEAYRLKTIAMMKELVGGSKHREVLWLGAPVAKGTQLEEGVRAVNLIARQAAAEVPGVTYVDTHALFDDDNGRYQSSFADETGKIHVMRTGDGIHFSADGGDFVGRYLFRILDSRWHLTRQADPAHPLTVRETEGTTQYPGTHRDIGATVVGRTSSSGTSPTTRPRTQSTATTTTTAAPPTTTTAPPTTTTSAPPTTTTTAAVTGG